MNIINTFKINKEKSLELLVPSLENKFNYSYEPMEKLHKFDKVAVIFKENEEIEISSDMVYLVLETFKLTLIDALNNKITIPKEINVGEMGYYHNLDHKKQYSERFLDSSSYSIWAKKNIQTWMYNKNNKIYLEIFPEYPWFYDEPLESNRYIPFDEFIKTYKAIAIEEIDYTTAQKWLEQCNAILDTIADKDNS